MIRRLDSALWAKINQCYSALGRRMPSLGEDISHFHCERWRNSVMSPFFLKSPRNWTIQLRRAESYFQRHGPKRPFDAAGAYINLLDVDPGHRNSLLLAAARRLDWKVDIRPNTMNVWENQRPLVLAKSFHLVIGRYFDRAAYRGFRNTMVENFGTKPKFMHELDVMMQGIEERVRTVLLYHEGGMIAGGGLVATNAHGAFLFCGSVGKRFRGKGLWNALVSARQMVSAGQGAKCWITTTRTKGILGKGDFSFPLTVLSKDIGRGRRPRAD